MDAFGYLRFSGAKYMARGITVVLFYLDPDG
jgi:hypothetical protein